MSVYMCVCVCVCVRERKREREREHAGHNSNLPLRPRLDTGKCGRDLCQSSTNVSFIHLQINADMYTVRSSSVKQFNRTNYRHTEVERQKVSEERQRETERERERKRGGEA